MFIRRVFKVFVLLVCLIMLICASACERNSGEFFIVVKGSRSMSFVFEKIAEAYKTSVQDEPVSLPKIVYGILPAEKNDVKIPKINRSEVTFVLQEGGSGRGIGSLLDGNKSGEIILSTRDLTANEIRKIENVNRTYIGDVIYVFKYSEDNIIPITNLRNPKSSISKIEMKRILQGRTKSWNDIFPQKKSGDYIVTEDGLRIDNSIQMAFREPASSINYYLRTKILSGIVTKDLVEITSDLDIIDYTSRIYNSISFISSVYRPILENNGVKEMTIMSALLDSTGGVEETIELDDSDAYMRKNCNIIFMKNQETIEGMSRLGGSVTVDEVILDFINFSNAYSEKGDDSESLKGKDIGEQCFSFDFILDQ